MQFEYDAFVMYSSEDKGWVVRTLIPTLEEKCVYICRKTIAVNYCGTELDYALHQLMEKKGDSLVVIKLDDVDIMKLPRELQKGIYIHYPKSTDKETWEKKLVNFFTST
ncbi:unnamed protein product [Pocillopora meandrina]|uniref:TIR domain-containing protein n=1 Tax=Pocillopora meandrina TaxID=46732 RepID=A0AAU9VWP8_9CNID|nr:unnamed protein product [Pocillopora meandrina]